MDISYLSVASGIEAATMAWHPLGWRPAAFAQFDPDHKGKGPDFASAVLKHHYPDVPNLGDMTKYRDWPDAAIDVLVGGTPCQSFSVAGLRAGLDDERGNLMLVYGAIARKYRPRWVVWENVPGVFSDDGGRSFAGLLGLLAGRRVEVPAGGWKSAGIVVGYGRAYGLAWRVLDSQFVRVDGLGRAVPQRRRRVFVVGYLGDWRRAAAVLFERASMSGDPAPRRKAGQGVAGAVVASAARRGGVSEGERGGLVPEVTHALRAEGFDASEDGTGRGTPLVPEVANPLTARMHKGVNTTMDEGQTMIGEPIVFQSNSGSHGGDVSSGICPPLRIDGEGMSAPAIAFDCKAGGQTGLAIGDVVGALHGEGHGGGRAAVLAWQNRFRGDDGRGYTRAPTAMEDVAGTLDTVKPWHIASSWVVRRLTPEECERLQGFPSGFTNIPWRGRNDDAPDGPRYKVLGNSMSVNVMRWIGYRIEMVEDICKTNIDNGAPERRIAT